MKHRSGARSPVLVLLLLLGFASASWADLRIGVAPFERAGTEDVGEDPAAWLARSLAERALDRVVGPEDLGAPPRARPEAREVRAWARSAEVDYVIVGSSDPAPEADDGAILLSAEVRSGHSGAVTARYKARADGPERVEIAAEKLAIAVLDGLGFVEPAPRAEPLAAGLEDRPEDEKTRVEIGGARRDEPISIRSDELEVIQVKDSRRLIFTHNVVVTQADVTLETDKLEAFYPDGSSQPERLEASGRVRVRQGRRRAFCDTAIYEREAQIVLCSGHAELVQGCDRVRGDEIRFDLEGERVVVVGAPSVVIHPNDSKARGVCAEEAS
ncbi:MAG: hypothetical protein O7G30_12200 [Proteobacteria bacterium]|nr:hypothetical protein [Pseudomonadota bacterium]